MIWNKGNKGIYRWNDDILIVLWIQSALFWQRACTSNPDRAKQYTTFPKLKQRLAKNGMKDSWWLLQEHIGGALKEACTHDPNVAKPSDAFPKLKNRWSKIWERRFMVATQKPNQWCSDGGLHTLLFEAKLAGVFLGWQKKDPRIERLGGKNLDLKLTWSVFKFEILKSVWLNFLLHWLPLSELWSRLDLVRDGVYDKWLSFTIFMSASVRHRCQVIKIFESRVLSHENWSLLTNKIELTLNLFKIKQNRRFGDVN